MKFSLLLVLIPMVISCNSSTSQEGRDSHSQVVHSAQKMVINTDNQNTKHQNDDLLKFQYYRDQKSGLIQSRSPLPSSWLMHQDPNAPYSITGPNGIKVSQPKTEQYGYSQDPFALQTIQMSGQQIAPVYSLEQILDQLIRPSAEAQGYSFVRSFSVPSVQTFWERFTAALPQTGSHRSIYTLGSEWEDTHGHQSLITLVQLVIQKGQMINWTLQTTEMEAPASQFQKAKEAYLYAVSQTEINPQWQQYMNGKLIGQIRQNDAFWAQASAQSAQAHQQRMTAIQARGAASRSVGQIYSEISDINHSGYLKRSNMVSEGQSRTVNAIGGHAIIGNNETGERYQVEAGSRYYWVNKDGEYFGTDNSLYDPRIDNRINGEQWQKFQIEQ